MKKLIFGLILALASSNIFAYSLHNQTGYNLEVLVEGQHHTDHYHMNWYRNYESMDGFTPREPVYFSFALSKNSGMSSHSTTVIGASHIVTFTGIKATTNASITFTIDDNDHIKYTIDE